MTEEKIIEIINKKGVDKLKAILKLTAERITPENLPEYDPNATQPENDLTDYEKGDNYWNFSWDETPWFCANIEKELTQFFSVPTELCFESDYGWYFATGEDGHFNTKIKLYDLESEEFDCFELVREYLPCDYVGRVDAMEEQPFLDASKKKYYENH